MEQQSKDWLAWRHQGLGSSDAPVIMNVSPWKTPFQLWQEKTTTVKDPRSNYIMEKGNRLEPIVRNLASLRLGVEFQPALCQHVLYPWLRASLDGLCAYAGLEIKYVGKEDQQTWGVPAKYWPQIQHQFLVSGAAKIYYASYYLEKGQKDHEGDLKIIDCLPDRDYITDYFLKAEAFWNCVVNKTPPPMTDRDRIIVKDKELVQLARKYARLEAKRKEIECEQDEIKERFNGLPAFAQVGVLRITEVTRKGNIDYGQIPELQSIDLEKFRKPETKYKKIEVVKK